jgi:hypothetical protein
VCELCQTENSQEETALARDDGLTCEFQAEENAGVCSAPAVWLYTERYVNGHLCEEHAEEMTSTLGEGLIEMLQTARVSEGEALEPIESKTDRCDQCNRLATCASITIASTHFCADHRGYPE